MDTNIQGAGVHMIADVEFELGDAYRESGLDVLPGCYCVFVSMGGHK